MMSYSLQQRMDQYFDRMEKIISQKKMAPRVCFMLQDVLELRKSNWVPRREDNKPKTLNQINVQAQQEEVKQKMLLMQQPTQQRGASTSGQYGDRKRGSQPKEKEMQSVGAKVAPPVTDDIWMVQSGKGKSQSQTVDPAKFTQIASKVMAGCHGLLVVLF